MSSMKFAKGPLYAALSIGAIGVALLLSSRLGIELPFEGDLIGAGLGLVTIVLLLVSVILGSRAEGDDDDDAITDADLMPSVTFGPQGEMLAVQQAMSAEERKAQKEAAKLAKKEEAERLKFEKKAQKEAAKAAKRAGKGGVVVDDTAAWLGEIKQEPTPVVDETSSFGSVSQPVFQPQQAAAQPVFQPQPPVAQPIQMTPIATAAAEMIAPNMTDNFGVPTSEVDMSGAASATDAPMYDAGQGTPEWAGGAYEDPSFQVPFSAAPMEPVATPDVPVYESPEVELDDVVVEEVAEEVVEVEPEPEIPSIPEFPDVDTSLEDEVDDESITEVEERLDKLAADVLVLIENARGEVRTIRRDSEAARRRHNEQVTSLAGALSDSRDEMTRLAEELAEAGEHQKAALDAQSMLTQAQIETQKAELERQQAVARLRQVRVAVLRQDPVDQALLAVVEKSLHDLLGQAPATDSDSETATETVN